MHHFYLSFPDPNNRVMAPFVFEVARSVEPLAIESIVRLLWEQHAALRSRFQRDASGRWEVVIDPYRAEEDFLTFIDTSQLAPNQMQEAVNGWVRQAQSSFRVDQGNLCQFVIVDRPTGPRHLVMLMHHLVSDQWSDFILTRDMLYAAEELSRGAEPKLPRRTTDIRTWGETLAELGRTGYFEAEANDWLLGIDEPFEWPADRNLEWKAVGFELDEKLTAALRVDAPKVHGATVDEIFACVVAQAVSRLMGRETIAFNWLDAGRSDLPPGIDLSRTVGLVLRNWPHRVMVESGAGLGAILESLRAWRARTSHRGLGFDVLRLFSRDEALRERLSRHPSRDLRVNFIGDGGSLGSLTRIDTFKRVVAPTWKVAPPPVGSPGTVEIAFMFEKDRAKGWVLHRCGDAAEPAQRIADLLVDTMRAALF
jgi:hypothetical protein